MLLYVLNGHSICITSKRKDVTVVDLVVVIKFFRIQTFAHI